MKERDQFGPSLRAERERRGISLQEIADTTKIGAALFAGLERNDLSRWPSGIYRRSFVRAYAEALDLDADQVVEQFQRLFPAEGDEQVVAAAPTPTSERPGEPPESGRRRRVAAFALDLGLVAAAGCVFLVSVGWPAVWPALAVTSGVVLLATPILVRTTPGTWLMAPRRRPPVTPPAREAPREPQPIERPAAYRRHHASSGPNSSDGVRRSGSHSSRHHRRRTRRRATK